MRFWPPTTTIILFTFPLCSLRRLVSLRAREGDIPYPGQRHGLSHGLRYHLAQFGNATMRNRAIVRRTHDYKRNSTVQLYAAPEVHVGRVIPRIEEHPRSREFIAFMSQLLRTYPSSELHVILDNVKSHGAACLTACTNYVCGLAFGQRARASLSNGITLLTGYSNFQYYTVE